FLRDLLFYKTAPELADVLEIAIIDEQFKETANTLDAEWIEEAIMKFNDCQQQIKSTNSPKKIIDITFLSIASREKKATTEQIQTTHTQDENQSEWVTLNKKLDDLEKKVNNINISDIKEQPKLSSGQRRQSSANRQSS